MALKMQRQAERAMAPGGDTSAVVCNDAAQASSSRLITLVLLTLLTLLGVQAAAAQGIFRGTFEDEGSTPVTRAIVELRAADESIKATARTDGWAVFPAFPVGSIEPGDSIVVYGGDWDWNPLIGEFRLVLDQAAVPQRVNVITTLVTAVANSALVSGSTPAQRLDAAVALLQGLGFIDADWRNGSPARVNHPLSFAVNEAGGMQSLAADLIEALQQGQVDERWMQIFPHVNAGSAEITVANNATSWLPGDNGTLQLSVVSSLEVPPAWQFVADDVPGWMTILQDGEVQFMVPANADAGPVDVSVSVLNPDTGASRSLSFPFRIEDVSMDLQVNFDGAGGTFWAPSGEMGLEIPPGAVNQPTKIQWLSFMDDRGGITYSYRFIPANSEFLLPVKLLFPDESQRKNVEPAANCGDEDTGWEGAATGWHFNVKCEIAAFAKLQHYNGLGVGGFKDYVDFNRLALGALGNGIEFPVKGDGSYELVKLKYQTSWRLHAGCQGGACSGKEAIIFVHGYVKGGGFGGGRDTWADTQKILTEYLNDGNFVPYIFSYRTNARFEDVARDLGKAVDYIVQQTGNPVRILAHSFGGVVARAYVQGLADTGDVISPPTAGGCAASRHPKVDSLLTAGSPHSGIATSETSFHGVNFPVGSDMGKLLEACFQLSCWETGAGFAVSSDTPEALLAQLYGVDAEPGETTVKLADFTNYPLSVPTLALIGMKHSSRVTRAGDGLISYQGQRFTPQLSCAGGSCDSSRIPRDVVTSIDGQEVGSCLYERVMGSGDKQYKPGDRLRNSKMIVAYSHSSSWSLGYGTPEAQLEEGYLPGADPAPASGHLGSTHDLFNFARAWLTDVDPDPAHDIDMRVTGWGTLKLMDLQAVELGRCRAAHPENGSPTDCHIRIAPGTRKIRLVALPDAGEALVKFAACDDGPSCYIELGSYENLVADFSFSRQGEISVSINVSGGGKVHTGDGRTCQSIGAIPRQCTFVYPNGTSPYITLAAESSLGYEWAGWSGGACSGMNQSCHISPVDDAIYVVSANFRKPNCQSGPGQGGGACDIPGKTLNDTGITWSGHTTSGNASTCAASHPAGQDCHYGRDARARAGTLSKIGASALNNGVANGFDYTKISNAGNALPASAALGSGPNDWACTRDNVTGLIWEVKTTSGLRSQGHTYTWYDSVSPDGNPGSTGNTSSCGNSLGGQPCNTQNYVQAVNDQGLCGANDWRMPTREELRSIVDYGRYNPAIDTGYFPNTPSSYVWSGSPSAFNADGAWNVNFVNGYDGYYNRSIAYGVRLVRGGQ